MLLSRHSYEFDLPKEAKKGNNYKIVLTDTNGDTVNTGKFSLKPKTHWTVKVIIPAAIVGGTVYWWLKCDPDKPLPELPESAFPRQ